MQLLCVDLHISNIFTMMVPYFLYRSNNNTLKIKVHQRDEVSRVGENFMLWNLITLHLIILRLLNQEV